MLRAYKKPLDVVKDPDVNILSIEIDLNGIEMLKPLIQEAERVIKEKDTTIAYVLYEEGNSNKKDRVLVGSRDNKDVGLLLVKRGLEDIAPVARMD